MFELPRGITGFGIDNPTAQVDARRDEFVTWARAIATGLDSQAIELPLGEPKPSFDLVRLERANVWLLHNRFVPLVGVMQVAPVPGASWAVAGEYVDLNIPEYARSWGPRLLGAEVLNQPLARSLEHLGIGAVEQARRYKPELVGHVVFNYWA